MRQRQRLAVHLISQQHFAGQRFVHRNRTAISLAFAVAQDAVQAQKRGMARLGALQPGRLQHIAQPQTAPFGCANGFNPPSQLVVNRLVIHQFPPPIAGALQSGGQRSLLEIVFDVVKA